MLFLVFYVCITQGLGTVGPALAPAVNWNTVQAWVDPFVAMLSVLETPGRGLERPGHGVWVRAGDDRVLRADERCRHLGLRKWNPSGEPIMQREGPGAAEDPESDEAIAAEKRAKAHAAPGAVPPACGPTRSCGARCGRSPTAAARCSSSSRSESF